MANPQPQPDGASKLSLSPSERQMEVDQDWALEHYQELVQRFPGEYLLVRSKQVIAHGKEPAELMREANAQGYVTEELTLIAFPDPLAEIPH